MRTQHVHRQRENLLSQSLPSDGRREVVRAVSKTQVHVSYGEVIIAKQGKGWRAMWDAALDTRGLSEEVTLEQRSDCRQGWTLCVWKCKVRER